MRLYQIPGVMFELALIWDQIPRILIKRYISVSLVNCRGGTGIKSWRKRIRDGRGKLDNFWTWTNIGKRTRLLQLYRLHSSNLETNSFIILLKKLLFCIIICFASLHRLSPAYLALHFLFLHYYWCYYYYCCFPK